MILTVCGKTPGGFGRLFVCHVTAVTALARSCGYVAPEGLGDQQRQAAVNIAGSLFIEESPFFVGHTAHTGSPNNQR